jgi:hypothetical protein
MLGLILVENLTHVGYSVVGVNWSNEISILRQHIAACTLACPPMRHLKISKKLSCT